MVNTQKDLTALQTHPEFIELDGHLNKKLDKMETHVISIKKSKMTRDRVDYESENVYSWKMAQFPSGRSQRNHGKRVSFSDPENELINDTMAVSASDSSPECSIRSLVLNLSNDGNHPGNPQGHHKKVKQRNNIRKPGEEARDTRTPKKTSYTLRGRKK